MDPDLWIILLLAALHDHLDLVAGGCNERHSEAAVEVLRLHLVDLAKRERVEDGRRKVLRGSLACMMRSKGFSWPHISAGPPLRMRLMNTPRS